MTDTYNLSTKFKGRNWIWDYVSISTKTTTDGAGIATTETFAHCEIDKQDKFKHKTAGACNAKFKDCRGSVGNTIRTHAEKHHGFKLEHHVEIAKSSDAAKTALNEKVKQQIEQQQATGQVVSTANATINAMRSLPIDQQMALARAKNKVAAAASYNFGQSGTCTAAHHELRYYSQKNFSDADVNGPLGELLESKNVPLILSNRREIPRLMIQCGELVRRHQLSRFAGATGAIACDGGTKFHRLVAFVLLLPATAPIFLSMVDVSTLKGGSLSGDELNRLLSYFKKLLRDDFLIDVIAFIADNAQYMHSNYQPAALTSDEIAQVTADTTVKVASGLLEEARRMDPFIPSVSDGIADFNVGSICKKRCTAHSFQLVVESMFDVDPKTGKVRDGVPSLVDALAIADTVGPSLKNARDSKHKDFREDLPLSVQPPEKGSPTRWWCKLNYLKEAVVVARKLNLDQDAIINPISNAISLLEPFKQWGDRLESYHTDCYDSIALYIFLNDKTLSSGVTSVAMKKIWTQSTGADNRKVARRTFWHDEINLLIAFFHPCYLFNKSNIELTVWCDYVRDSLENLFGVAVAVEYDDFRMFCVSNKVVANVKMGYTLLKTMSVGEYRTFYNTTFSRLYPHLVHALTSLLGLNHTEVECERVFSACQHLFPKDRANISAVAMHGCLVVNRCWKIAPLTASNILDVDAAPVAPATNALIVTLSGVACRTFVQDCLSEKLKSQMELEKANNVNLDLVAAIRDRDHQEQARDDGEAHGQRGAKKKATRGEEDEDKKRFGARTKAVTTWVEREGAKFNIADKDGLICTACDKKFLDHADVHGRFGAYDWFIQCGDCDKPQTTPGCLKFVHSDCTGILPCMRTRVESFAEWLCAKCTDVKEKREKMFELRRQQRQEIATAREQARKTRQNNNDIFGDLL
jgi:hypothetical protein